MKLANLIDASVTLSPRAKAALHGAIATRGKRKGFVLNNKPSGKGREDHAVAWESLIGVLAPVRMSVWFLMTASADEKELWTQCNAWCERFASVINHCGQAPFQFNLWHHHHDLDETKIRALLARQSDIDKTVLA